MSDNPEALPQPKQHAPIYPDESRADQYAASRYVSGWNECHAAFTAALAQQAATPTLTDEQILRINGDEDSAILAETDADIIRFARAILAASRQAATPAPAKECLRVHECEDATECEIAGRCVRAALEGQG